MCGANLISYLHVHNQFTMFTVLHVCVCAVDPHNLGLRCRVNGVTKQDSNTNQLVHKTQQILAFVSRYERCFCQFDILLTSRVI